MNDSSQASLQQVVSRAIRAAKLDVHLYEEVEADQTATKQALGVVVVSNLAAGFGTVGLVGGYGHILIGTLAAIAGWVIWAFLAYWIGTRLLPEPQTQADLGQMLRTTGFSSAPGVIRILGILPGLTGIAYVASGVWMLIAMVIAVRQALDYRSTWRAVAVCAIGWLIQVLALALIIAVAG